MWPVIRRTSVPPTEMSKDHRPHHRPPTGGAARPACRRWERHNPERLHRTGYNFTAWTHTAPHPVECRAGGTVVA